MASALLTTGKAARMCSVKPDTVLKWIKKGVLPACRTAGGHYRVEEHDLSLVLSQNGATESLKQETALCSRPMRCWEYMNNGPGADCRDCVVYKVRASYCFRMVGAMKAAGHAKRFCSGICQECPYYRRVHGLPTNVLVITREESLIRNLAKRESASLAFRFARRGYDASAIITVFRPAFVIFDEVILERLGLALLDAIAADPRTMGTRILVAIRNAPMGLRIRHEAVYATIQLPFDADEVLAIINRTPVEPLEAETAAKA
jgi:excisionase family DNA binding protein